VQTVIPSARARKADIGKLLQKIGVGLRFRSLLIADAII